MNSTGTPPIVQKNRFTPGTPMSIGVTSLANVLRLVADAAEVLGQERQRCEALRCDVAQMLGNIEHLDQTGVATTEHGDVRPVGRWPAQRRLQHVAWNPKLELDLDADDFGEERDKGLRRMALHDNVMKLVGHTIDT